jgi:hypothetical protein
MVEFPAPCRNQVKTSLIGELRDVVIRNLSNLTDRPKAV